MGEQQELLRARPQVQALSDSFHRRGASRLTHGPWAYPRADRQTLCWGQTRRRLLSASVPRRIYHKVIPLPLRSEVSSARQACEPEGQILTASSILTFMDCRALPPPTRSHRRLESPFRLLLHIRLGFQLVAMGQHWIRRSKALYHRLRGQFPP